MPEPLKLAELCAGYGGLGLALELAGIDHQLAWYAEHSPEPAAVMAYHHPGAPNLGDLTNITNPPPADIITAGFPCQPVSSAGRRQGVHDDRWIIDDVCRVARLAGAQWLLLENVAGLLTANDGDALARVCAAMAREGFSRWEWRTLRASDIGACHHRRRWFCVAHAERRTSPDPDGRRRQQLRSEGLRADVEPPHRGDPDGCLRARFGGYATAVDRHQHLTGRKAPDPTVAGRLSPAFVEWMMALPLGHVTDVPDLPRSAQLSILGNGVVPPQAAHAITDLLKHPTSASPTRCPTAEPSAPPAPDSAQPYTTPTSTERSTHDHPTPATPPHPTP